MLDYVIVGGLIGIVMIAVVAMAVVRIFSLRPRPEMPIQDAARSLGREIVGIQEHIWGVGMRCRRAPIPLIYPPQVVSRCLDWFRGSKKRSSEVVQGASGTYRS